MLEEREKSTRARIQTLAVENLRELVYNVVSRQPEMIFHLLQQLEQTSITNSTNISPVSADSSSIMTSENSQDPNPPTPPPSHCYCFVEMLCMTLLYAMCAHKSTHTRDSYSTSWLVYELLPNPYKKVVLFWNLAVGGTGVLRFGRF